MSLSAASRVSEAKFFNETFCASKEVKGSQEGLDRSDIEGIDACGASSLARQPIGKDAGTVHTSNGSTGKGAEAEDCSKTDGGDTAGALVEKCELEVSTENLEPESQLSNSDHKGARRSPMSSQQWCDTASATNSEDAAETIVASIGFDRTTTLNQANGAITRVLDNISEGRITLNDGHCVKNSERNVVNDGGEMVVNANLKEVGTTHFEFEQEDLNDSGLGGGGFGNDDDDDDFPLCANEELNDKDDDMSLAGVEGEAETGLDPSLSLSPTFFAPALQKRRKSICASPSGSLDLTKSSESDGVEVTENKAGIVEEIEINSDNSSMVSSLAAPLAGRGRKVQKEIAGSIDDENASIYSWRTQTGPERPLCSLQQLDAIVAEELAKQRNRKRRKSTKGAAKRMSSRGNGAKGDDRGRKRAMKNEKKAKTKRSKRVKQEA